MSLPISIPLWIEAQPASSVRATLATPTIRVPVRADSRLWLEGSSNVRDWTCKAGTMEASIDFESGKSSHKLDASSVRRVRVKVPVRKLKCGDRHMEAQMYTALKAPKNPAEGFITAEFDNLAGGGESLTPIEVAGKLTIAGVQRAVTMTVMNDRMPDGTHRARGTVPILMTDFGIKPPRPWGGILKTANKVLIQFEIFIDLIS